MTLARRLGWRTDSAHDPSSRSPVALEVYPHSSMVGLFDLRRVLEYKAKSGRTVQMRKEQFDILMGLMECHCNVPLSLTTYPRWQELRARSSGAVRQSELNLIEDEIDAIFCAYIAWSFLAKPDALTSYGDASTGIIHTFPPPRHG